MKYLDSASLKHDCIIYFSWKKSKTKLEQDLKKGMQKKSKGIFLFKKNEKIPFWLIFTLWQECVQIFSKFSRSLIPKIHTAIYVDVTTVVYGLSFFLSLYLFFCWKCRRWCPTAPHKSTHSFGWFLFYNTDRKKARKHAILIFVCECVTPHIKSLG